VQAQTTSAAASNKTKAWFPIFSLLGKRLKELKSGNLDGNP
jgi:hypothetical protein